MPWNSASRVVMALVYLAAGVNHFRRPEFYARMIPPYLPAPGGLVLWSGVAEVVLGLALLVPRTARAAAWGVLALLVAVFPANVHMATHPADFPEFPPAALWLRLPLQALLIAWAYWHTRPRTLVLTDHRPLTPDP